AGLPHRGVHEDGRVEPHHVAPLLDEVAPPHALDVVLQLHAERAVVPARARAAVDLAGLEDETPALGQRDDHIHRCGHARSPEISSSRFSSRRNRPLRVGWPMTRASWVSSTARSSGPARPIGVATASSQRTARSRSKAAKVAGDTGAASAPGRRPQVSHSTPPPAEAGWPPPSPSGSAPAGRRGPAAGPARRWCAPRSRRPTPLLPAARGPRAAARRDG